jgi:hypothetical protein
MDDLKSLILEMKSQEVGVISTAVWEIYCKRYLHYYHHNVERQPIRFFGAWGWSEARRREFRTVFESISVQETHN